MAKCRLVDIIFLQTHASDREGVFKRTGHNSLPLGLVEHVDDSPVIGLENIAQPSCTFNEEHVNKQVSTNMFKASFKRPSVSNHENDQVTVSRRI